MSEEAMAERGRSRLGRSLSGRRWIRLATEVGYDAAVWIAGLIMAARATSDLTGAHAAGALLWYGAAGIFVVVAGCGLLAGLYRGRHLRGSRDEVTAVALAGLLT